MPAAELAKIAGKFCPSVSFTDNPCDAFDLALKEYGNISAIVVCGSLYLAGDVRLHMIEKINNLSR